MERARACVSVWSAWSWRCRQADGASALEEVLPLRFPRIWHWAVLALAVAVGLAFVPPYRTQGYREAQRDREVIKYRASD